jgi:hypothetical protein
VWLPEREEAWDRGWVAWEVEPFPSPTKSLVLGVGRGAPALGSTRAQTRLQGSGWPTAPPPPSS